MPAPLTRIFESVDYEAEILRATEMLRSGKLLVLPTETVYGIAGVLTHTDAYRRLREHRSGQEHKPLTLHIAQRDDAMRYIGPVSELARRMMRKLWPGPVALLFEVPADRRREVAGQLRLSEQDIYVDGAVTLRCPDHPVFSDVVEGVSEPVVMTAAGQVAMAPAKASALAEELEGKVDLVVDAGATPFSKPSTIVRVGQESYEIVREGVYDRRIIERLMQTTILFVCSGNTCRSPMAEALARKILAEKLAIPESDLEKKGYHVLSAGAMAFPGARATPQAVEAVTGLGADLSKHRSRPLTVELIHQADMIFAMGVGHTRAITALVPSSVDKVSLLSPTGEIDDPIGSDVAVYQTLAGQMNELIRQRLTEKSLL